MSDYFLKIKGNMLFLRPHFSIMIILLWALNGAYFIRGNLNIVALVIWGLAILLLGVVKCNILDVLLLAGLFFWQYVWNGDIEGAVKTAVIYWFTYYIGKLLGKNCFFVKKQVATLMISVVAIVFAIRAVLNYSYLFFVEFTDKWPMWGGAGMTPRTQHEFYILLPVTLIVFWCIYVRHYRISILGIVISILLEVLALYGQGKMSLCATIVVGVVVGAMCVIENITKVDRDKLLRGSIISGIGLLVMYIVGRCLISVFGMTWSKDGGILHNVRFILWKNALKLMMEHPFESTKEIELAREIDPYFESCAHNTWIDIGRTGGVIPFILIIAFTVMLFVCCYKLWKNERAIEKYAIIVPFLGVTLYHMFEPAILANPSFWSTELLLGGIITGWWYGIKDETMKSNE